MLSPERPCSDIKIYEIISEENITYTEKKVFEKLPYF